MGDLNISDVLIDETAKSQLTITSLEEYQVNLLNGNIQSWIIVDKTPGAITLIGSVSETPAPYNYQFEDSVSLNILCTKFSPILRSNLIPLNFEFKDNKGNIYQVHNLYRFIEISEAMSIIPLRWEALQSDLLHSIPDHLRNRKWSTFYEYLKETMKKVIENEINKSIEFINRTSDIAKKDKEIDRVTSLVSRVNQRYDLNIKKEYKSIVKELRQVKYMRQVYQTLYPYEVIDWIVLSFLKSQGLKTLLYNKLLIAHASTMGLYDYSHKPISHSRHLRFGFNGVTLMSPYNLRLANYVETVVIQLPPNIPVYQQDNAYNLFIPPKYKLER